jgi:hypothetical protein
VTWKHSSRQPANLWKLLGDVVRATPESRHAESIVHSAVVRGHVSCVVTGFNRRQYTAYCFTTGCEGDVFAEDVGDYVPDPIIAAPQDVLDVEKTENHHPRDYFLDALVVRAEQLRVGWETIIMFLQGWRDHVVSPPSMLKRQVAGAIFLT